MTRRSQNIGTLPNAIRASYVLLRPRYVPCRLVNVLEEIEAALLPISFENTSLCAGCLRGASGQTSTLSVRISGKHEHDGVLYYRVRGCFPR